MNSSSAATAISHGMDTSTSQLNTNCAAMEPRRPEAVSTPMALDRSVVGNDSDDKQSS